MNTESIEHLRSSVMAMVGREGRKRTEEYLSSEKLDSNFRRKLVEAGILVDGEVDFSKLPVRKADILTSASIGETHDIVSRLIKRDGIDYTIADFSREPSKQFQQKLVEAKLMSVTPIGKIVNISGLYGLADLEEKSSDTGSIQPVVQSSPL